MLILKISKKLTTCIMKTYLLIERKRMHSIDKRVKSADERKVARRAAMNKEIEEARTRWADGVDSDTKEIQELYKLR